MVYDCDRTAVHSVCLNGVHERLNPDSPDQRAALPMHSAHAACQSQQTRMEA